jgi:hypothetical protein
MKLRLSKVIYIELVEMSMVLPQNKKDIGSHGQQSQLYKSPYFPSPKRLPKSKANQRKKFQCPPKDFGSRRKQRQIYNLITLNVSEVTSEVESQCHFPNQIPAIGRGFFALNAGRQSLSLDDK